MVEVKGAKTLVTACVYPVADGIEVFTNTTKVREARRTTLELILSNHRKDCLTCLRNQNCELQKLSIDLGVDRLRFADDDLQPQIECSTACVVRDNSKCVLCRRCTAVCKENQDVAVIGPNDRGFATHIGSPFGRNLGEMACVSCGQCIVACPTGALTEVDDTGRVYEALADESKHVVVMAAPAVRVALGECFGMPIGANVEGKMVAALRRLGFDSVFDVNIAADVTVLEEGAELIDRLQTGENLPIIVTITCLAAVIISGYDAAKGAPSKGWLWGMAAGAVYAVVLVAIGTWVSRGFTMDTRTLTLIVLSVAGGGLGGVLGINLRR